MGESLPASVSKIGFPSWWLLRFKIEHLSFSVACLLKSLYLNVFLPHSPFPFPHSRSLGWKPSSSAGWVAAGGCVQSSQLHPILHFWIMDGRRNLSRGKLITVLSRKITTHPKSRFFYTTNLSCRSQDVILQRVGFWLLHRSSFVFPNIPHLQAAWETVGFKRWDSDNKRLK